MTLSSNNGGGGGQQFGDTTLTKVFVGGLAWETPKDAMRDHFEKYGDILEAVIISDKLTGRSKGYGFVTFKEAEAAKKACEDATPIINGRRANCNLASLGARRPRSSAPPASTTPPPPLPHHHHQQPHHHNHHHHQHHNQQGSNVGVRSTSVAANHPHHQVQWYYPSATTAASPAFSHHAVPYYGYTPTYIATDMGYNQKLSYGSAGVGGAYMSSGGGAQYGHHQVYPGGQAVMGAMPVYPMYQYYGQHQQSAMGLPMFSTATSAAGPIPTIPTIISKPPSMVAPPPTSVCLAVE